MTADKPPSHVQLLGVLYGAAGVTAPFYGIATGVETLVFAYLLVMAPPALLVGLTMFWRQG